MSIYIIVFLLIIGLVNIIFVKNFLIFIAINILLIINIMIKALVKYKESIGNLISSPILWRILYEIRVEIIALIILVFGYMLLNHLKK